MYKKLQSLYTRFKIARSPQMNVVMGFFLYSLIGFGLLSIPWFHKTPITILDNLFTATSAVSTTGLVTVSVIESYTIIGQIIIMFLFQLGGIGYLTFTTYFLLSTTKYITHWHEKIINTEFTLPKNIEIKDFIRSIIVFTFSMEIIGSILLYIGFHNSGITGIQGIGYAIFHSISAFCTAGFSLFDNGFIDFSDDIYINIVLSILAIAGSLGFIVITDLWYRFSGKSTKTCFTTKIIGIGFVTLLLLGTFLIYFSNTTIEEEKYTLLASFFQAMSSMTTVGLNTVDIGAFALPVLLLTILLMYIGASPSGTSGGLKITTVIAMIAVIKSRLSGRRNITFLNRKIPFHRLYIATSSFILYTTLIFTFTILLTYFENFSLEEILFEVASALGTVGLSMGITSSLSVGGKICIIILMFVGRVGVLTFGFALLHRKDLKDNKFKEIDEDLAV